MIIKTNRYILRNFQEEDAQGMFDLNNDQEVLRYTGDKAFESIEEARQFILHYDNYTSHGFGRWTITDQENNYYGWCGLKQHESGMVDLGYRIKKSFWGLGIASETAMACVNYGREVLKLTEIVGRSSADNLASVRVLEKCGMTFWKKEECHGIKNALIFRIRFEENL